MTNFCHYQPDANKKSLMSIENFGLHCVDLKRLKKKYLYSECLAFVCFKFT